MFGFGIMLARLLAALRASWHAPAFRGTALSLLLLWVGATVFYARQEHWSFLDSFYFAVCTGLTIGYGDFAPTSAGGKVFTVVYALLSVGLFAALATQLGTAFVDRRSARTRRHPARGHSRGEDEAGGESGPTP